MMTSKTMCAVLLLVGSTLASAEDTRLAVKSEADRKVVNTLETMKVSLNFSETPLPEVVDFFREITNVNIIISKGVKESGAEHNLSLKVDELRAADALALMLQMTDLSFKLEDGVIMIVTMAETKADAFLEVYDVRDLLFHLRDFAAPEISLKDAGSSEEGLGIVVSGSEESGGGLEDPTLLVELIKNHSAGTSWTDNAKCSVEIQNGILIVTQTKEGHRAVSSLIEKLRQYK